MLTGQLSSALVFALAIASMFVLLSAAMMYARVGTSSTNEKLVLQELRTEKANADISRMIKPENICFAADSTTLERYPSLAQGIESADKFAEDDIKANNHYGNLYTGTGLGLDKEEMISLIKTYHGFNQSVSHETSVDKLFTYQKRYFTCGFSYSDKYYQLAFPFTALEQVNRDQGYVPIRITQGLVERTVSPLAKNLTTYAPFNNTAVFFNELPSGSVTINVSRNNNNNNDAITENITIPSGRMYDLRLGPDWSSLDNTVYHYKVSEYPWIEGNISVSPQYNSECMDKEVAKSLYLQSDFNVRFPSYLPEGFKPACNAENLPSYLIQIYVNQTAVDHYKNNSGVMSSRHNPYPFYLYAPMSEEQVKGIVQVHAQKYYFENPREQGYKTYQSFLNNTGGFVTNPQFFNNEMNDTSYLTYNEGRLLSVVVVLTDDAGYRVVGALPMEEAMKIAKSLFENQRRNLELLAANDQ